MAIYQHIRHPRITSRLADRPVKVLDLLPRGTAVIDTPPDDTIGPEDETWSDDETTGPGPNT